MEKDVNKFYKKVVVIFTNQLKILAIMTPDQDCP